MPDRFSGNFGQEMWDLNDEADMIRFVKSIEPSRRAEYFKDPALLPYSEMHRDAILNLIPWDDRFGEWLGPIHFCMDPPESIPESENRGEGRDATGQEGTTEPAPRVERD